MINDALLRSGTWAELAQELGLRTPSTLLIPEVFVSELREMNEGGSLR